MPMTTGPSLHGFWMARERWKMVKLGGCTALKRNRNRHMDHPTAGTMGVWVESSILALPSFECHAWSGVCVL